MIFLSFDFLKNPFLKTFPNLDYFLKIRFSFYLHIFDPAEIWSSHCKESGSDATIFPILPCSFLPSRLGARSQVPQVNLEQRWASPHVIGVQESWGHTYGLQLGGG